MNTDILVIGSGIAGLNYALKVADHAKVIIITKSNEDESNTKYAQGGVAAVFTEHDSFKKHIEDTLIAGDGLCDSEVVEIVVKEGPERIRDIIDLGVQFDKEKSGNYDLAKEGGHSEHRVLHFKDITGYEIERALLEKIHLHPNIQVFSHYFAVEIITEHHLGIDVSKKSKDITCFGAYVLNSETNKVEKILSKITMMAAGGCGQVYSNTTNPVIATGDGIAMVYRAKGKVRNCEFIQFHPTALYNPSESPSFLISEAVRGAGAILRNNKGEDFTVKYDKRGSLAPRDVVARAIDAELKRSGSDNVYLDCTSISKSFIMKHFPNIYNKCLSLTLDMTRDYIPVVPAAHYMCGGILVDTIGKTSITNLLACGECSSTGLHGANRLASNSLLEAVVFAHRSASYSIDYFKNIEIKTDIPEWNEFGTQQTNEFILVTHNTRELQRIMSDYVGIVRSDYRLERAFNRLKFLYEETEAFYKTAKLSVELCELRNLIQMSYIIVKSAMLRKESRGLHYTTDYNYMNKDLEDTIF